MSSPSSLTLVGISHHVAPVELRERMTLDLERAGDLSRALGEAVHQSFEQAVALISS